MMVCATAGSRAACTEHTASAGREAVPPGPPDGHDHRAGAHLAEVNTMKAGGLLGLRPDELGVELGGPCRQEQQGATLRVRPSQSLAEGDPHSLSQRRPVGEPGELWRVEHRRVGGVKLTVFHSHLPRPGDQIQAGGPSARMMQMQPTRSCQHLLPPAGPACPRRIAPNGSQQAGVVGHLPLQPGRDHTAGRHLQPKCVAHEQRHQRQLINALGEPPRD